MGRSLGHIKCEMPQEHLGDGQGLRFRGDGPATDTNWAVSIHVVF